MVIPSRLTVCVACTVPAEAVIVAVASKLPASDEYLNEAFPCWSVTIVSGTFPILVLILITTSATGNPKVFFAISPICFEVLPSRKSGSLSPCNAIVFTSIDPNEIIAESLNEIKFAITLTDESGCLPATKSALACP